MLVLLLPPCENTQQFAMNVWLKMCTSLAFFLCFLFWKLLNVELLYLVFPGSSCYWQMAEHSQNILILCYALSMTWIAFKVSWQQSKRPSFIPLNVFLTKYHTLMELVKQNVVFPRFIVHAPSCFFVHVNRKLCCLGCLLTRGNCLAGRDAVILQQSPLSR